MGGQTRDTDAHATLYLEYRIPVRTDGGCARGSRDTAPKPMSMRPLILSLLAYGPRLDPTHLSLMGDAARRSYWICQFWSKTELAETANQHQC